MRTGRRRLASGQSPDFYLSLYKSTTRPQPCVRCQYNGYYQHPEWGRTCAACLLDLINIGEVLWKWDHYPEVWRRMDQQLSRRSGIAKSKTESVLVIDQTKKAGRKSGG